MSATKTKKSKTPASRDPQNPEAATSPESPPTEAGSKPAKPGKATTRPGVRIVSVGFPSKVARQLKLLSSISGESIASIVVGAVSRVVAKRLPEALAELAKVEESGDGE